MLQNSRSDRPDLVSFKRIPRRPRMSRIPQRGRATNHALTRKRPNITSACWMRTTMARIAATTATPGEQAQNTIAPPIQALARSATSGDIR